MSYLIVGLGNPGDKYKNTRHNIGFVVLDKLAEKLEEGFTEVTDLHAQVIETNLDGTKVILAKPTTYMNRSGEAVHAIAHRYGVNVSDVWVVYDDVALPFGILRVRLEGSAGGHNGIKSLIDLLHAEDFVRFRIGVNEAPENIDLKNWVLSKFNENEREAIPEIVEKVTNKILEAVKTGSVENITENIE